MDEHPAHGPAREEGRVDPRRHGPRQARRGRRGRDRRPHRRRDGRRGPAPRAPAGRRPARRSRSRWSAPSGPFVLLDIGANPDSTPENLAQYARMGAIFAERVLGVDRPRVALLSIGEEKGKGDARIQRATELLDETDLNFVGNVEGKDLTAQVADVVVCDAVLGNVVIKFFEGLSGFIFDQLRARVPARHPRPARLPAAAPRHRAHPHVFDYEVVGGSPLLGVRGTVIITHGRAKRRMIEHAVRVGATTARERVPERIAEALGTPGRPATRRRGGRAPPPSDGGWRLMTALTVGPGVIRETVRLAALEVPGVVRVGRGGPAWRNAARPARPSASASATAASTSPSGSSPARASRSMPSPRRSARPSAAPSSACSASSSAGSPSWSMASGPDGPAPGATARATTGPGPAGRPPARARGRLRGGVRPADRRRDPRAPPGRGGRPGGRRDWPASSSATWSCTATRSTPGSPPRHPSTRSSRSPGWTARCSVAACARCYTRPRRRPGWRSPSGSSWPGPTRAIRCDAS